jgi:hypothetical protein
MTAERTPADTAYAEARNAIAALRDVARQITQQHDQVVSQLASERDQARIELARLFAEHNSSDHGWATELFYFARRYGSAEARRIYLASSEHLRANLLYKRLLGDDCQWDESDLEETDERYAEIVERFEREVEERERIDEGA